MLSLLRGNTRMQREIQHVQWGQTENKTNGETLVVFFRGVNRVGGIDWLLGEWRRPRGPLLIHADLLLSRTAKVKSLMRMGRH